MERSSKNKKVFAIILIIFAISLIGTSVVRYVADKVTGPATTKDGKFEYIELADGTIEITKYVGTDTIVNIPSTIEGKTVTSIAGQAFYYSSSVNIYCKSNSAAEAYAKSNSITYVIDDEAPTCTITTNVPNITNADSIIYTFTFSEEVTGFEADDIEVTNGTKGTFTAVSSTVYTLVVTNSGSCEQTISIGQGVCTDAAENENTPASIAVTIDRSGPHCAITTNEENPTNADSIVYTFLFDEDVKGFTKEDITVTNGTKETFVVVSSKEYTLEVTNTETCTQTVSIPTNVLTDMYGNVNAYVVNHTMTIDKSGPHCAITASEEGPTNADSIVYTFLFDEDVKNFTEEDITVTNGAKKAFTAASSKEYKLEVTNTGSCTQTVRIQANTLTDMLGNPNEYSVNQTVEIDKDVPTVTITAEPSENPTNASSITYTIAFSEEVTGFEIDDVIVTNGTKGTFTAVSSTVYTLVVTNSGSCEQTISIGQGVCTDAAENENTPASIAVTIDRSGPHCAITTNEENPTNADSIVYTFLFDEEVKNFTEEDITVTNGAKKAFAAVSRKEYTLEVTNTETCTQTVSIPTNVLTDMYGNVNAYVVNHTMTIDKSGPHCAITASEEGPTNADSIVYTFLFDEDVKNFTEEDITVTNGAKKAFTAASSKEYKLEVTNTGSCTQTVRIQANTLTDMLGNPNEYSVNQTVEIDKDAPTAGTMTMKFGSSTGSDYTDDTWTDQNVYIEVNNGIDEQSGHKSTTYSVNGGEETSEPQILKESGTYKIKVTTTDNAGNIATNLYTIKIKRIESILVTSNPTQLVYIAYENFSEEGMKVSILYDNGDKEETTEYTITNGERLTCKVTKIEIQYNKNPEIKTELEIKVGHIEVIDMEVEPTCTEKGKTEGKHCDVCNTVLVEQRETAALDHSFTNYISNNDATCTEDGTKTAKCDRCAETHTVTDEGSALGHNYTEKVTKPTCTEKGYTTHICTRCKDTYVDTYTDELDHSFTNYISNNDATCTEDGTKTAKCDRCAETHTVTDEGSVLGHNYEENVTNPTCTQQGYTTHTCTRCKDRYVDTLTNALGHSFTNYISNNDATCTEDGSKTAKCDRCDETHTIIDEGSAHGHNYEEGECTECGDQETEIEITSEKYNINETDISKINPKTTVSNFIANLQTNATEINIYNKNKELLTDEDIIATGMQLELKLGTRTKIFTIIVLGDLDGNGEMENIDLLMMVRYKAGLYKTLDGEYLKATDLNNDNNLADDIDLLKMVRILVGLDSF